MRKVFVALAFVAVIVSATMLPEVRIKASSSFAQLQKSRVGKNILTAIQLEMTSKNTENIVNRVLVLLNELLNQTDATLTQTQTDLGDKVVSCDNTRVSYEQQIEGKTGQINQGESDLPNLRLEKSADETNKAGEEEILAQANSDLTDANDANDKAVAAHAKSTRNHNAMIEALNKARALIVTLKSSSFLQKASSQILAQITAHTDSSLASLATHANKDIFQVLMQMSQEVAIQADQELVGSVVEIIDDLLKVEADGLEQEAAAENERQTEYNNRVESLNNKITNATNEILRLEAEIVRLGNEIDALVNNLEQWKSQLVTLNETLAAHNGLCATEISNLEEEIVELTSEVDVIRQVIVIFESADIQDIKSVVDDLEYTE